MLFYQNKNKITGFTLIELLIVIVIIGILATALFPRLQGIQHKARITAATKTVNDLKAIIFLAQTNTNKTLMEITNHGCTICECSNAFNNGLNINTLPANDDCRQAWIRALRKIEVAAGYPSGTFSSLEKDPRGAPYLLDENEEPSGGCAYSDHIDIPGPDGKLDRTIFIQGEGGLYDKILTGGALDGLEFRIPPTGCPGAY